MNYKYLISSESAYRARETAWIRGIEPREFKHIPLPYGSFERGRRLLGFYNIPEEYLIGEFSEEEKLKVCGNYLKLYLEYAYSDIPY